MLITLNSQQLAIRSYLTSESNKQNDERLYLGMRSLFRILAKPRGVSRIGEKYLLSEDTPSVEAALFDFTFVTKTRVRLTLDFGKYFDSVDQRQTGDHPFS